MKKFISVSLSLLMLACTLSSCGETQGNSEDTTTENSISAAADESSAEEELNANATENESVDSTLSESNELNVNASENTSDSDKNSTQNNKDNVNETQSSVSYG